MITYNNGSVAQWMGGFIGYVATGHAFNRSMLKTTFTDDDAPMIEGAIFADLVDDAGRSIMPIGKNCLSQGRPDAAMPVAVAGPFVDC